jgi:RING finger protein 113A
MLLFRLFNPAMSTAPVNVSFFKKGKSRPTTTRKRSSSPKATVVSEQSHVVLPSRKAVANLLSAGTKRTTSQRDEYDDEPEKDGPDVKWTAAGSHVKAAQDILDGDEADELLANRVKKQKEADGESDEEAPEGVYKGQQAYRSHIKKSKEIPKAMRVGPQRSTNTIRTVTIVDYQPDVCKDYKGQ